MLIVVDLERYPEKKSHALISQTAEVSLLAVQLYITLVINCHSLPINCTVNKRSYICHNSEENMYMVQPVRRSGARTTNLMWKIRKKSAVISFSSLPVVI